VVGFPVTLLSTTMAFINQTTLLLRRALFAVLLLAAVAEIFAAAGEDGNAKENYCNICGEGNSIQFPTGVVEFMYKYV